MPVLTAKIRAARTVLAMSQHTLAERAGLHRNTVSAIEQNQVVDYESLLACQSVLEAERIEFFEAGGRHGLIVPSDLPDARNAILRAARVAMLLERADIASIGGLAVATVARIEEGQPNVGEAYLRRYIGALGSVGVAIVELEEAIALMLPQLDRLRVHLASRAAIPT